MEAEWSTWGLNTANDFIAKPLVDDGDGAWMTGRGHDMSPEPWPASQYI
jgi:hypothetical protein